MELKKPPNLSSVTCHRLCMWKILSIASVYVLLYAICLQFSLNTIGQPRDWALNEQKRIVRRKATEAKEKGVSLTSAKEKLDINEEELPSEYLPDAWACLCVFITVYFIFS